MDARLIKDTIIEVRSAVYKDGISDNHITIVLEKFYDRIWAAALQKYTTKRPLEEWHEDCGDALWWTDPVCEPPYCGTPLDCDWPGYHTHWTPLIQPEDNP